jgi:hypothetical protein
MHSFLRSLVAFLTLGMCCTACTKSEPPKASPQTDVVLAVPGMH